MDKNNIKVIDAAVLACPPDRSPIFFVNIDAEIKAVKSKLHSKYNFERMVVKGTIEEIKNSDKTKRSILKKLFDGKTNKQKLINEFDLSRITILNIIILESLGYGVKSD